MHVHAREAMPSSLSHFYVVCPPEQKLAILRALVKREVEFANDSRALVFASPNKPLSDIANYLNSAVGRSDATTTDGDTLPQRAECLRDELGLNERVSGEAASV